MQQNEKLFTEEEKNPDSSCFTIKFLSAKTNTDSILERVDIFLRLFPLSQRNYLIFSSSMKDIKE